MADVLDKVITLGSVVGGEDGGKRGRDGFSPITKLEDLGESLLILIPSRLRKARTATKAKKETRAKKAIKATKETRETREKKEHN